MDVRASARWASYAQSRTAQKRDARRRQAARWREMDAAVAEALVDLWIDPGAAWRRWQAQE